MENNKINVLNRSDSIVIYTIPEMGIRREFAPGEKKRITKEELEALTYRSGGTNLIRRYLIVEEEALEDLSMKVEPEYWLDDEGVKKLLLSGSLDEFLDCLDFAPAGVIDLIKHYAVSMPLNDVSKREALKEKTGYDVDRVLMNVKAAQEDEKQPEAVPQRRVQKEEVPTGRRTTPKYKVVKTKE